MISYTNRLDDADQQDAIDLMWSDFFNAVEPDRYESFYG